MLAKLTCRGRDFADGRRPGPAGARGVPDPRRRPPTSRSCRRCSTTRTSSPAASPPSFIEEHPQLLTAAVVGRPRHQAAHLPRRRHRQPAARRRRRSASTRSTQAARASTSTVPAPDGTRQQLLALGPEGFARGAARADARSRSPTPPSATPTSRCWPPGCAPATCSRSPATSPGLTPELLVARGVGRRDVRRGAALPRRGPVGAARRAARRRCRTSACRCCCAAATPSATRRTRPRSPTPSSQEAAATGIDIFRIFDALNDVEQMRPGDRGRARRPAPPSPRSRSATPATCSDPDEKLYTLDYYLGLAERIVDAGAHVLAIKDMAGLLRAPAARDAGHARCASGSTCRCTCTPTTPPGGQLATLLAAIDAGVDAVDAAMRLDGRHHLASRRCRRWSRPPTTPSATTGLDLRGGLRPRALLGGRPPGLRAVRVRACASPTGRVYTHEIPGGQLSNLRQQAIALGLGEKFEQIEDMYAAANRILGNIVKVTPSSKVVGDLALHLVARRRRPGGVRGRTRRSSTSPTRSSASSPASSATRPAAGPSRSAPRRSRAAPCEAARRRARPTSSATALAARRAARTLNRAAVPRARPRSSRSRRETLRRRLGAADHATTSTACAPGEEHEVELEEGKRLLLGLQAIGERRRARHPHGDVHDQRPAAAGQRARPRRSRPTSPPPRRPTPRKPGQVAAPFARRGHARRSPRATRSRPAPTVATIEAMKMEASITAPVGRHGRAARHRRHPAGRGRRPRAGPGLTRSRRPGQLHVEPGQSPVEPSGTSREPRTSSRGADTVERTIRATGSTDRAGSAVKLNQVERRPSAERNVSPRDGDSGLGADQHQRPDPAASTGRCRRG